MSESVVKLRIDSKEYDANIKRAGDALTQYFQKVREGGGTLMHLDEGVMEAVQAMGELGTKASNTRGGLRELTQATIDMTTSYRALTDEERNSPLGQAMAQSIAQMTERAGQMRDAMADVNAAINNTASDTRMFDQLAGAANVAVSGFQTLQGATKLLGIDMGDNVEVIAKLQAAMAVTNGLTQIQTALQKQSAVMQGVAAVQAKALAAAQALNGKNTLAATAAQKAFNLVAKANPYILLGTAIVGLGSALVAFSAASRKAEREIEEMERKSEELKRKTDSLRDTYVGASAEMMSTASRLSNLQTAYRQSNSEIEKTNILKQAQVEFKKLGLECKSVTDAQNLLIENGSKVIEMITLQGNAAAISAVRMEKFKESFSKIIENRQAEGVSIDENAIRYAMSLAGAAVSDYDNMLTGLQSRIQGIKGQFKATDTPTNKNTSNQTEEQKNSKAIAALTQEYQDLATAAKTADDAQKGGLTERMGKIQAEIGQLQARNDELKRFADEAKAVKFPDGSLPQLNQQLKELQAQQAKSSNTEEWQRWQREIDAVTRQITILKGELPKGEQATFTMTVNDEQLAKLRKDGLFDDKTIRVNVERGKVNLPSVPTDDKTYTMTIAADTKGAMQTVEKLTADIEHEQPVIKPKVEIPTSLETLKQQIQVEIDTANVKVDETTLHTILKDAIQNGINTTTLDLQPLSDQISQGINVEDEAWQRILDAYNELREQIGLEPITIDFKTGNTNKNGKEGKNPYVNEKGEAKLNDVLSGVASGMSQVVSGIESLGVEIPQGIKDAINAVQGVSTILTGIATTILAIEALTTANTIIPFARGGIVPHAANGYYVPGNHYSGDTTPILANAGELVLSKSQQNNLASGLQGAGLQNLHLTATAKGEDLILSIERTGKRKGYGELCWWR